MSRAFVNEDAGAGGPKRRYLLPARDDPAYDAAAAETLLEAAREGETPSAEEATGYYWGEQRLHTHVRRARGCAERACAIVARPSNSRSLLRRSAFRPRARPRATSPPRQRHRLDRRGRAVSSAA